MKDREVCPSDFDGHTAFQDMTFTQKLDWISEAAVSVYLLAKENPTAGCRSLFTRSPKPGQDTSLSGR